MKKSRLKVNMALYMFSLRAHKQCKCGSERFTVIPSCLQNWKIKTF